MPRNGSDIYFIPPGTEGFPDTTIESEKYNSYIHDVETDLNRPRPIVAGGTGANDANEARINLDAEVASQVVTNYDTHVWESGSFCSQPSATAGPIDGHLFVGTCTILKDDPKWITLEARDLWDGLTPGRTWIRQKKNDVWEPWTRDATGVSSPAAPVAPSEGMLWWNTTDGQLYIYYTDVDATSQWVIASPSPDPAQFLRKAGDVMEGPLGLQAPPVSALQAANKKYVDDMGFPPGTSMMFHNAAAPPGWTRSTGRNDSIIRISDGAVDGGGTHGLTAIRAENATGPTTLTAAQQASMPISGTFSGTGSGSVSASPNITPIGGGGGADGSAGWSYAFATVVPLQGMNLTANVNVSGSISGTATGSGQGHTHPIILDFFYTDMLLASKN